MPHPRGRRIKGHVNATAALVRIGVPETDVTAGGIVLGRLVQVVGKLVPLPILDTVQRGRGGVAAHRQAATAGGIGKHLQNVGIVQKNVVKKDTLLGEGQLLVAADRRARGVNPVRRGEKTGIGAVGRHKQRLAACTGQNVRILKVVNQLDHRLEVTGLQLVVNTPAQKTWKSLVQVVVIRAGIRQTAAGKQAQRTKKRGLHRRNTVFHTHSIYIYSLFFINRLETKTD